MSAKKKGGKAGSLRLLVLLHLHHMFIDHLRAAVAGASERWQAAAIHKAHGAVDGTLIALIEENFLLIEGGKTLIEIFHKMRELLAIHRLTLIRMMFLKEMGYHCLAHLESFSEKDGHVALIQRV